MHHDFYELSATCDLWRTLLSIRVAHRCVTAPQNKNTLGQLMFHSRLSIFNSLYITGYVVHESVRTSVIHSIVSVDPETVKIFILSLLYARTKKLNIFDAWMTRKLSTDIVLQFLPKIS